MNLRPWLLPALLLGALGASADIVTLKDGRVLEGKVVEDDGKVLKLKMRKGTMALDRKDIESVQQKATPEEEYQERVKKLDPASAPENLELARWAGTKDLDAEAIRHLLAAWKLDEKLAGIAEEFAKYDWHFYEKAWHDPDSYYPTIGYTKFEGHWCSPKELEYRKALKVVQTMASARDAAKSALAAYNGKNKKSASRIDAEKATIARISQQMEKSNDDLTAAEKRFKAAQDKSAAAAEKLQAAQDKDQSKEGDARKDASPAVKDAEKKLAAANAVVEKESKAVSAAMKVVKEQEAEKAAAEARIAQIEKESAATDKERASLEDDLEKAEGDLKDASAAASDAKAEWEKSK